MDEILIKQFNKFLNDRIDAMGNGPDPDPFNPYAGNTVPQGQVQPYYGMPYVPTPDPDPDPPTEIKTKLDLQKSYERKIEKALDEMTPAQKYMLYKHMYIGGMRIGDCEPGIARGLDKEFKALKK